MFAPVLQTILVLENGIYTAYSPNLPGVIITGEAREEVERRMNEAIQEYLDRLGAETNYRLMQGLLKDSVPCMWDHGKGCGMRVSKNKDGLCSFHWRKAYGHSVKFLEGERICRACGELDVEVLKQWDAPCPMKPPPPNAEQLKSGVAPI